MTALVLNIGSINIDHVYRVPHFVQPGETLASLSLSTVLGGKGANQSVALAKAGINVSHVGRVSSSDQWAVEIMSSMGVNVDHVTLIDGASGHAIIQVDDRGENAIVLHGGANQGFDTGVIERLLNSSECSEVDYVLMQNETNQLSDMVAAAKKAKLKVALNPAPMTSAILDLPLEQLDVLIVNQVEAEALCGESDIDSIIASLGDISPNAHVVLTLGAKGAILIHNGKVERASTAAVEVVDTTGAGDTFVGYFLAGLVDDLDGSASLQRACNAAAIAVTRAGATPSIPELSELYT